MLILSESDVRSCLSIPLAIRASKLAFVSLSSSSPRAHSDVVTEKVEATTKQSELLPLSPTLPTAIVPQRLMLPSPMTSHAADCTLIKPAALIHNSDNHSDEFLTRKVDCDNDEDNDNKAMMGVKIISLRSPDNTNSKSFNPKTPASTGSPATICLINPTTGVVNTVMSSTFLTATRTAAGSALATQLCCTKHGSSDTIIDNLVVFGAGLQGEQHIHAIRSILNVKTLTIVNRSRERADTLRDKLLLLNGTDHDNYYCDPENMLQRRKKIPLGNIQVVLLRDSAAVELAVRSADVIVTATNTTQPLFPGEWVNAGCHINGVGSYTPHMIEIDETLVNRCRVLIDTQEARSVGDLKHLQMKTVDNKNIVGLLGDFLYNTRNKNGMEFINSLPPSDDSSMDCTFFKSVGTAIQDIVTAQEVLTKAKGLGLGIHVEMG